MDIWDYRPDGIDSGDNGGFPGGRGSQTLQYGSAWLGLTCGRRLTTALGDLGPVDAVGHRIVHGGDREITAAGATVLSLVVSAREDLEIECQVRLTLS